MKKWDKIFNMISDEDYLSVNDGIVKESFINYHKDNIVLMKSVEFALDILEFTAQLYTSKHFIVANQLLKSGTSIGANITEATAAISKKDFISKMSISAKEARESSYWLLLIQKSRTINLDPKNITMKCDEINRIITTILRTAKGKS